MNWMRQLSLATMIGMAASAHAQTAGGPAQASPGAQPTQTPLTSSGTPRSTTPAATPAPATDAGAATPASPQATGANKPARPRAVTHRRIRHRKAAAPVTSDQGSTTNQ